MPKLRRMSQGRVIAQLAAGCALLFVGQALVAIGPWWFGEGTMLVGVAINLHVMLANRHGAGAALTDGTAAELKARGMVEAHGRAREEVAPSKRVRDFIDVAAKDAGIRASFDRRLDDDGRIEWIASVITDRGRVERCVDDSDDWLDAFHELGLIEEVVDDDD